MNANLGIVLHKSERESTLRQLPPETRSWGDEVVEVDAPNRYAFPGLDGVEFHIYPVTDFIRSRLPASERSASLEYAWMTGAALSSYASWSQTHHDEAAFVPLELGFVTLLRQLCFWAVLFAPEGERVGEIAALSAEDTVRLLRHGVQSIAECPGFLALSE
ncbi:hypothetical protein LGM89_25895 [Burkholderia sp. AU31624]|uniref:hypothetical protein n=1 Tax=unclassified Burkholderia TaxID=2613784 RepID=UPI000B7ADA54|nr:MULTISPECIES: hypothetical protein [unclassified Burkholderia]MCA8256713.1 hypothetical protein [Burkholderia sp. AU31624]OXI15895.1 hypothetical protein CFB43_36220 [Burkholderia sp. AU15512]